MERKFILSGGGITLALVLCVFYIFGAVLKTPLLEDAPTIKVEMPRTGGLFKGSQATFRGVRVGKVTNLDLSKDGVEATVKLAGGTEIPADSKVQVRSLSPVGEQYLDFQPDDMKGPFLKDGSVIKASAVDLPQTLWSDRHGYRDFVPEGGTLVGFQVTFSEWFNTSTIGSIHRRPRDPVRTT